MNRSYSIALLIATLLASQPIYSQDQELACSICPEMVFVAGGTFAMGDTTRTTSPIHEVSLAYDFYVSKYPITVAQFTQFMDSTSYGEIINQYCWSIDTLGKGYSTRGLSWENPGFEQTSNHPVVCVTWIDAQRYINWLNAQTSRTFRLLTEAEWEYIARQDSSYPQMTDDGNVRGNDRWEFTAPVDAYEPNKLGIYDMRGNTFEWMADCVNGNYLGAPADGRAWTKTESLGENWGVASSLTSDGQCLDRITRSRSWLSRPTDNWVSRRGWWRVQMPFNFVGFRLAETVPNQD